MEREMRLQDMPKSYAPLIERLYKMLFGVSMSDAGVVSLSWIKKNLTKINRVLDDVKSENTRQMFRYAVKYVVDGPRDSSKNKTADKSAYNSQYKAERSDDPEFMLVQRALSYLVKVNKTGVKTSKNSISNPSTQTTEKYGLYKVGGIWYSKIVEDYCDKNGRCSKYGQK
jgi:hypothetical protein